MLSFDCGCDSPAPRKGPVCEVRVSGLPEELLTSAMMEVMLEQAGVEGDVVDFRLNSNSEADQGEAQAVIAFANGGAAKQFAVKVQGCKWGVESQITAKLTWLGATSSAAEPMAVVPESLAPESLPDPERLEGRSDVRVCLSEGIPAFVRGVGSQLSKEAAPFIPLSQAQKAEVEDHLSTEEILRAKTAYSEVSTDAGESEAEVERSGSKVAIAAEDQSAVFPSEHHNCSAGARSVRGPACANGRFRIFKALKFLF